METLFINNKNGQRLAALIFEPPASGGHMVIICHGFRGGKENSGKLHGFAVRLQELGMGVIAFDFRGSGASDGEFALMTLTSQASDLQTVIDYAHHQYGRPVILLGRSFGGSTVLAGGSGDERVAGYVLWSAPVFLEKTFAQIMAEAYNDLLAGENATINDDAGEYRLQPYLIRDFGQHDMDQYLRGIGTRPVLIIHAEDDETVAAENPLYIKERLPDSTLYMVDNAGHRFLDKIRLREDLTLEWLKSRFEA